MIVWAKTRRGFTIVELLVVVVVIAILASVTVVAYTGVTGSASDSAVQSDLRQIAQQVEMYKVKNGDYPHYLDFQALDIHVTKSAYGALWIDDGGRPRNLMYCSPMANHDQYTLVARSISGEAFKYGTTGVGLIQNSAIPDGSLSLAACSMAGVTIAGGENDRQIMYAPTGTTLDPAGWVSWVNG